jgi:hypothetical protein
LGRGLGRAQALIEVHGCRQLVDAIGIVAITRPDKAAIGGESPIRPVATDLLHTPNVECEASAREWLERSAVALVERQKPARYGSGSFAAEAEQLRLYRPIATMDASVPLPSLDDQTPTWGAAAALAREWELSPSSVANPRPWRAAPSSPPRSHRGRRSRGRAAKLWGKVRTRTLSGRRCAGRPRSALAAYWVRPRSEPPARFRRRIPGNRQSVRWFTLAIGESW